MSSKAFEEIEQCDIVTDQKFQEILCTDNVSPDRRWAKVVLHLEKKANRKKFVTCLEEHLAHDFDIRINHPLTIEEDLRRLLRQEQDYDNIEGSLITIVGECLDFCIPDYAVVSDRFKYVESIVRWTSKLRDGIIHNIPNYQRPKELRLTTLEEKRQLMKLVKFFGNIP
ncbi:unnamed protein product [marine sediment metagenome]|uniref:Uncharacterized protein n=1 Tax=marine sediment metagenome TaxID=412755 RepID=X1GSX4_9ZZZZ